MGLWTGNQHPHPMHPSITWPQVGRGGLGVPLHCEMPSALSPTCQSSTAFMQDISKTPGLCWDRAMG